MPILAVAPHWGAWIEILIWRIDNVMRKVAPHWGAWIEILRRLWKRRATVSHPTGVRGLK